MHPAIISQRHELSRTLERRDTDFSVKGIIGSQQVSTNQTNYCKVQLPSQDLTNGNSRKNHPGTYDFTMEDLLQYFFGKTKYKTQEDCIRSDWKPPQASEILLPVNSQQEKENLLGNAKEICCGICQQGTSDECPMHGPLQSLRKLVKAQHHKSGTKEKMLLTYAVTSFPPEVQLCESSVPGHCYGVSARQFIPIGTWIGPYEGVRLPAGDLRPGMNTSYMWEIYQDGQITSYLDGSDENVSSWMRFIRCARHKLEQNLFEFQYCGNIYYRAFKDISPGTELLVWYDDHYDKFLGIPISLRERNTISTGHLPPQNFDHTEATSSPSYPSSSHVHPSLPQHCDVRRSVVSIENDVDCKKSPAIESLSVLTKTTGLVESADTNFLNRRSSISPNSDHLESGIWRCGQCFKSFTQRSLLQIHVCPRLPEKPYQCGHCAQSFSHPTDLRTHVVTHNSERPFKCGFCGRSFAGSTTLNNHIRTHTGEKPFVCEKCGRPFSQASQLSRHQRLPGDCHRNDVY